MAASTEIVERLYRRFKGVPNFEFSDAQELVDDSLRYHGYKSPADVPREKEAAVILYAQVQGAWQIAISVAHYFKFTDGEESVDKSMIADNYRRLARDLQTEYDVEIGKAHGNNFHIMNRIDRPITTPPTGESGKRLWRRF